MLIKVLIKNVQTKNKILFQRVGALGKGGLQVNRKYI